MGLIMNLTLDNGVAAPEAYFKAEFVGGTTESMTADVLVYLNKTCRDQLKPTITTMSFTFPPSVADTASNYHKQFYEWAKQQAVFSGAIDVLD